MNERRITLSNYKPLKQILQLSETHLKQVMTSYLKKYYPKVIENEHYVLAEGDIPIGLVAHLDTVLPVPPENIFFDKEEGVMWGPDGLGADDRAGVFAIVKIIQSGLRPHIILTTEEEFGGIGASMLAMDYPEPFTQINYLIELDRQGYDDCVFYNCNNQKFQDYIQSFGFTKQIGSFSDISIICPAWNVAGVNLSIGYVYEHSCIEHLFLRDMEDTIERVKNILTQTKIPVFKYREEK